MLAELAFAIVVMASDTCSKDLAELGICGGVTNGGTAVEIVGERPGGSLPDDWRPNDDDSSAPPDTTPQPPTPPRKCARR